ncbi:cell division regulator GpsB [Vagococcus sp. PNs007]|uniref:Cell division protein DivIVA n=2 Tax=Vagococcus TaxID=2737 RepID=A0A430ACR6_9ENTE|nr:MULTISPECIES: cell division regulator GpsB [Vagococcus]MDF0478888.1 cell division regulator GpsB [Vagococcus proximus]RSU05002.1 cell division protein DivIVA [Vagococcus fessus]
MTKNYEAREILQKEFKTKMRGYDQIEVDEFLDGIIKDYESYAREILSLKEEKERLLAKVDQLTKSQATLSRIKQEPTQSATGSTNFDILKRLSNLEKKVFGDKIMEAEDAETNLDETKSF